MNEKKYTLLTLTLVVLTLSSVVILNYLVDPYSFYGHNYVKLSKTQQIDQLRLSKVVRLEEVKPRSIVFGTSRAEFGYNPEHDYFVQPAYNLSVGGSSVYEARLYLEHAIKRGGIERVLFVADYIMFNSNKEKRVEDLESYFSKKNLFKFLFNFQTTRSSLKTFRGESQKKYTIYLENGQREHNHNAVNIRRFGGQYRKLRSMMSYFSGYDNNNHYRDTGKDSFQDLRAILELAYSNDIEMDVIFGPNHILHWESFDHYIGLDKWFGWKKDVLSAVEDVARSYEKEAYPVYDFSIYHQYTAEPIPSDKNTLMNLHWELNHYKTELGDLVMDRLLGGESGFGVKLTGDNIDEHIRLQKLQRAQHVDIENYRETVLINKRKVDLNQYLLRNFET